MPSALAADKNLVTNNTMKAAIELFKTALSELLDRYSQPGTSQKMLRRDTIGVFSAVPAEFRADEHFKRDLAIEARFICNCGFVPGQGQQWMSMDLAGESLNCSSPTLLTLNPKATIGMQIKTILKSVGFDTEIAANPNTLPRCLPKPR